MWGRLRDRMKPVFYWWIALILFNIGDLLSTFIGVSRGSYEGNPLWYSDIHSPLLLVFKLVVLPFVILPILAYVLSKPIFSLLLRTFTFMLLLVVIVNLCGGLPIAGPLSKPEMLAVTYGYMAIAFVLVWAWSKLPRVLSLIRR